MFGFTRLGRTTATGRTRILISEAAAPRYAGEKKNLLPERRDSAQLPPFFFLLAAHNSSAVISPEPSATARFTFPRLPADSQLCFELKRAHTNTRPSAISAAVCLLICPGQADTVQQTDKQHKRSGAFQFKTPRLAKEHY